MYMKRGLKLLILAGTAEARQIAEAAQDAGAEVQAWVTEVPRGPNPMPVPTDLISIDSIDTEEDAAPFDAVIDASHAFDDGLTGLGLDLSRVKGLPVLSVRRPGWTPQESDRWHCAADVPAAMAMIAPGARVFSATGFGSLPDYRDFPGARLFLRQTTRHNRPVSFDFAELVFGTPPFSLTDEVALFRALRIDTLICRNLGGRASRPKLDAALALGLKVILIEPPAIPEDIEVVADVASALAWLETL